METKVCPQCGETFARKRGTGTKYWQIQRFCSRACVFAAQRRTLPRVCAGCGAAFVVQPSREDRRYCSDACYRAQLPARMMRPCLVCGRPFLVVPSNAEARYCSRPCVNAARHVEVTRTCERCGKTYTGPAYRNRRFCSRACWGSTSTKNCERCGAAFTVPSSRAHEARYCSLACQRARVTKQCLVCGALYDIKASHAHRRKTCSKACSATLRAREGTSPRLGKTFTAEQRQRIAASLHARFSGHPERHPNFKGGAFTQRRGPSWEQQRQRARERDNHTCRCCGKTREQNGRNLTVHHIRPYRLFASSHEANDLANLISCCQACHMKLEWGKIAIP